MTVVLTNSNYNSNALPLVISSLQIAGLNATDFTIATGCNAPNYPSGQSCSPVIVFTPGAPGNRVATLVVNDNAANSPQLINLSGSIQAEALTIIPASAGGNSQSVTAGQTATFSLTVTPTFTGTISFSPCAGAPTTATCTIDPSPLPITIANKSVTLTVTVTTTTASASAIIPDGPTSRPFIPLRVAQIYDGILCSLLLMLLLRSGQRRSHPFFAFARSACGAKIRAPMTAGMAAAAFLAMTLLTLAGCGGASTVATAPTAVPPTASSRTYNITITPTAITSNNLPIPNLQPIQLTLTVD